MIDFTNLSIHLPKVTSTISSSIKSTSKSISESNDGSFIVLVASLSDCWSSQFSESGEELRQSTGSFGFTFSGWKEPLGSHVVSNVTLQDGETPPVVPPRKINHSEANTLDSKTREQETYDQSFLTGVLVALIRRTIAKSMSAASILYTPLDSLLCGRKLETPMHRLVFSTLFHLPIQLRQKLTIYNLITPGIILEDVFETFLNHPEANQIQSWKTFLDDLHLYLNVDNYDLNTYENAKVNPQVFHSNIWFAIMAVATLLGNNTSGKPQVYKDDNEEEVLKSPGIKNIRLEVLVNTVAPFLQTLCPGMRLKLGFYGNSIDVECSAESLEVISRTVLEDIIKLEDNSRIPEVLRSCKPQWDNEISFPWISKEPWVSGFRSCLYNGKRRDNGFSDSGCIAIFPDDGFVVTIIKRRLGKDVYSNDFPLTFAITNQVCDFFINEFMDVPIPYINWATVICHSNTEASSHAIEFEHSVDGDSNTFSNPLLAQMEMDPFSNPWNSASPKLPAKRVTLPAKLPASNLSDDTRQRPVKETIVSRPSHHLKIRGLPREQLLSSVRSKPTFDLQQYQGSYKIHTKSLYALPAIPNIIVEYSQNELSLYIQRSQRLKLKHIRFDIFSFDLEGFGTFGVLFQYGVDGNIKGFILLGEVLHRQKQYQTFEIKFILNVQSNNEEKYEASSSDTILPPPYETQVRPDINESSNASMVAQSIQAGLIHSENAVAEMDRLLEEIGI